jgi:seipin
MISLSLLNPSNQTLAVSSRPAILTYTSPLITTSLTLLNSPLLITGFKKEAETLLVRVMERFEFPASRTSRPRWANIEIIPDTNKIQVYSTKLIFVAQFEGVRYRA